MGIYVTKAKDPELYAAIYDEARRLIRVSDEIRVSVEKVVAAENAEEPSGNGEPIAYCIRCKKEIQLNPSAPYCPECYKVWKRYENPSYQEKYCHICGKDNTSTINKPVCYTCYKQHRERFSFKA